MKKLKKYKSNFTQNIINFGKGIQKGIKNMQETQIKNEERKLKKLENLDKSLTLQKKIQAKRKSLLEDRSGLRNGGSIF